MKALDACYEISSYYQEHGNVDHYKKDKKSKEEKKQGRKDKLENFKDKVANVVNKIGAIGVLAPFKKLMVRSLVDKGIQVNEKTELTELSSLFYDNIVRNKKAKNYEVGNFVLSAEIIGGIVSGVIAFFKGLKKKKDEGGTLTDQETKLLSGAEKIGNSADAVTQDFAEESIGEMIMQYWWIPVAGLVLYALFKR